MFLQLGFLLWEKINKPRHTHKSFAKKKIVRLEKFYDDSGDERTQHDIHLQDTCNFEKFPNFDNIKNLLFTKPKVSRRYGDPNDPQVLNWYKKGNLYPHPSVLNSANRILKRSDICDQKPTLPCLDSVKKEENSPEELPYIEETIYNVYCSRSLDEAVKNTNDKNKYLKCKISDSGTDQGILHISVDSSVTYKWHRENDNIIPRLASSVILYPPIFIPSTGRWKSALLDLSYAMEGNTNYVQIVIIREEEYLEYVEYFNECPMINFFVVDKNIPRTIGSSRNIAKLIGGMITENTGSNWMMMLDDNVLCWEGVTLVNDPYPQFGVEPSHEHSQRKDISFKTLLDVYSNKNLHDEKLSLHKFSIIGFSLGSHKNVQNLKNAYGRKHVFAAVLLNLNKLKNVHYENMWAMEDILFNMKTNDLSHSHPDDGIIVKCQRFIARKKYIDHGGVVPCNVPENVIDIVSRQRGSCKLENDVDEHIEFENSKVKRDEAPEEMRKRMRKDFLIEPYIEANQDPSSIEERLPLRNSINIEVLEREIKDTGKIISLDYNEIERLEKVLIAHRTGNNQLSELHFSDTADNNRKRKTSGHEEIIPFKRGRLNIQFEQRNTSRIIPIRENVNTSDVLNF